MSTLSADFKFEIGELLTHRAMLRNPIEAQIFMVTSRMLEQCPGGVQLHYRVRGVNSARYREASLYLQPVDLLEHELAPVAELDQAIEVQKRLDEEGFAARKAANKP